MTTKRLGILFAVLLAGLGSVYLLPHQLGFQPVGINLELPKMVGGWYGTDLEISQKELDVLGKDKGTEFARKSYRNPIGYELIASIILSGEDMSRSIHRPERCLRAQGFDVIDNRTDAVALPDGGVLHITRLQNMRNLVGADGKSAPYYGLTYYWFVGHTETTSSHLWRTWLDMRDRLFHGYNERWAYITVAGQAPQNAEAERKVDEWAKDFIKRLIPKIQKESVQDS